MTAGSQARFEQGFALHQRGRLAEAEALYEQVLREQPTHADAAHLRGLIALQSGQIDKGVTRLREVVARHPAHAAALQNLGLGLCQLGQFVEAIASFDRALVLRPEHPGLHADRGNALAALGRHEAAAESLRRAAALAPDNAEVHNNLGLTLNDLRRPEEALACFASALRLQPGYAEAYANQGGVLHQLGRHDEALALFERATSLKPDYAEAHYNRGNVLTALRRLDEALASYDRALTLRPNYRLAYVNRGNLLASLGRHDEALVSYDRALALDPAMAPVHGNRGDSLAALGRLAESAAAYDRAFGHDAYSPYAAGNALHARQHLCAWGELDRLKATLEQIDPRRRVIRPFAAQAVLDDPAKLLACTAAYAAAEFPARAPLAGGGPAPAERIRLAYVSGDFHDHPVMRLLAEVFERHDRSAFEIRAVSFGPAAADALRSRLEKAFGSFSNVRTESDLEIARLLARQQTDIAVDLMGYTRGSRPGIFSHRPAPLQATYLGYPGTLGSPCFDYLIADPVIAPKEHQPFYAEKLVQLPDSYLVNAGRPAPDSTPARETFGLPQRGFVFCCFNHTYKITPALFDVWMGLLRQVEGSVLWLFGSNRDAEANLRREAETRGVAPGRLVFAARVDSALYLPRCRAADLFLDTLPYNAHSTAADALWAGLPVLTCRGTAFPGRVAASLLRSVGLPELATTSLADYTDLALRLARSPEELAALRLRLEASRSSAPLFDAERFTRHLESAWRTMHERRLRGLPPEGFAVSG